MTIADVQDYLSLIPVVHRAPQHAVWLTYDEEADTLYVNFKKSSHATDSELTDEDVIIRYEGSDTTTMLARGVTKRSNCMQSRFRGSRPLGAGTQPGLECLPLGLR